MSSIAGDLNRIHVISGGAPKEVFALLAPKFEQRTGNKVEFTYAVITELREKLGAGGTALFAVARCRRAKAQWKPIRVCAARAPRKPIRFGCPARLVAKPQALQGRRNVGGRHVPVENFRLAGDALEGDGPAHRGVTPGREGATICSQ
jgi:hypothetical protein